MEQHRMDGRDPAVSGAHLFLAGGIVHLDPATAVFEAMLVDFDRHQASRNLKPDTRRARERLVRQLQAFTGAWPWQWTPAHFEHWSATHLEDGRTPATMRGYQGAIASFCAFIADARYQWPRVCEQYFGSFPAQVCHELNRIRHTTDYEGHPDGNRPLSKQELTRLFEVANQRPAQACRLGRKGELAAHRDAALLLTILGWGLRRTEASWLNVTDWRRNPAHPQFGRFGQLVVRRGKSARGSPPRRRVVLTVFPWSVTAVETYLAEVRPRFVDRYPDTGAMFPTERGQRITPKQINARFASLREDAGLDRHLGPHCLRHTYITTLLERGWPLALVQEQSGHSHAATTGIYTALSDDFKNRWIYRVVGGPFTLAEDKDA